MSGATAGASALLVIGLVNLMVDWRRERVAGRASSVQARQVETIRDKARRRMPQVEPGLLPGAVAPAYPVHAEPAMVPVALAVSAEPVTGSPLPLRPRG